MSRSPRHSLRGAAKSLAAFREACRHPDARAEVARVLGREQFAQVEQAAAVIAAAADALERGGRVDETGASAAARDSPGSDR